MNEQQALSNNHDDHHGTDDHELLDEQARLSRLVMHLAKLVNRGGRVEEQHGFRAVVSMPNRQQWLPNVVMAAIGIGMYVWLHDALFLVGGGVALLGWHRKLVAGAERIKVLVRVDDLGQVSERRVEPA
ncbi:MAG: hypothetical protein KDC46_06215 [Thermoleophilia bacterium]|nr:hypothetical protein [Thermoleophilia bacterium]